MRHTLTVAPASPAERRWEGLTFTQRFAVWSIRLWLADRLGDETAAGRSRIAFDLAGAADALVALDRMMGCVATQLSRPIQLAPVNSASLSMDESLLLRALTVAQADGPVDGLLTLRSMFGSKECRVVRHLCADYARALASAGLDLTGSLEPPPAADLRHGPLCEAAVR